MLLPDSPLHTPVQRGGGGVGGGYLPTQMETPLFAPYHPPGGAMGGPVGDVGYGGGGGGGGAALPLGDDRVVKWRRIDGEHGDPPQWVREELPASPTRHVNYP